MIWDAVHRKVQIVHFDPALMCRVSACCYLLLIATPLRRAWTYAWFRQCNAALDVVFPFGHAENQQSREDVVETGWLESRIGLVGTGHVVEVGLDVFDVGKFLAKVWHGREIETVCFGIGEVGGDLVGHGACATADVEGFVDFLGSEW
jgi:hypothetical protein